MKKNILVLITILAVFVSFGQTFEGKIVYKNTYKSKIPKITDEQFETMMGTTQEYYIKNGDYKSTTNGSFFQWQLYINKENKMYMKMANSETLSWSDATENNDDVLNIEINKNVTKILGYDCDEIILTCKTGIQKYYFNTTISVNEKLYEKHKTGNWNVFLSNSKSLPLKSIISNEQFLLESTANEINDTKLDNSFFELPKDVKTIKSSF